MQPVTPRPRATDAEPGRYADAREFFAAVRDAAREAGRIQSTARRMQDSEGLRGSGGFEPRVRSTNSDPSGMSRVDARIDFEAANERRLEEDYALIDRAASVLFGLTQRGDGGADALLGWREAKVMDLYYLEAMAWRQVASVMGMSERWCRNAARVVMDLADAYGIEKVIAGLGAAQP